ncbi:MAG: 50S ribosomal protein L25 [Planctomycetota bacterium]
MTDAVLQCAVRNKVGSRDSRVLRALGRMVASLQADSDHPHVNLHFDEASFHTARRAHVHLFDLEFDGKKEAAIVNELQWDALGDNLLHVEFKRVTRGQKTESVVPLRFVGTPAGILTHDLNEIHIRSIPSAIPDSIDVRVEGLEPGTHIRKADIELPEGVELLVEDDYDIATISDLKGGGGGSDAPAEGEGEGEGEAPAE